LHQSAFTDPVALSDILSFFGWLVECKFKDKRAAASTISSYKSALKWFYKEQKVIIEQSVDQGGNYRTPETVSGCYVCERAAW
jgi:hypothetical protein